MRNALLLLTLLLPSLAHAQGPSLTFESPNPEGDSEFGYSVSGVPDADGDGRGDVLIGDYVEDSGAEGAGRAYLFSGVTGALVYTLTSPNPEEDGLFGTWVSGVADTDGDGRGDLLVGTDEEDGGAPDAGRAYLFSGATGALLHTLTSPNPEEDGLFGMRLSATPDANGDGRGDLLIGAWQEDGGAVDAGRAYLFSGATGALLRTLTSPNSETNGSFGWSVSGVDADGDSRGDLLVSALGEDGGAPDAGRTYLFSGATLVASEPDPETPALGLAVVPNPTRARASFTLSLPAAGVVRLSVHDVLGREVAVLVDGTLAAGQHTAVFDERGLASGVYVWRLAAGGAVQTGRLTLLE